MGRRTQDEERTDTCTKRIRMGSSVGAVLHHRSSPKTVVRMVISMGVGEQGYNMSFSVSDLTYIHIRCLFFCTLRVRTTVC